MKEAFHERNSATLSFSFIAFSLDDIPDDLDHVDMLKPDDFNLEPEDLEPLSLSTPFSLSVNQL